MATYEEQQKALRATVPKDTAGATELASQGFTDMGTQPIDTSQPSPTQAPGGLSKVGTSAVGPDGKPIYDVFAGTEHVQDPSDPRLKGIDIAGLPEGQAPTGFKSKFETGFEQANQGLGDQAKDVSGTKGTALVNQYSPTKKNDLSSMFVQQDPFLGGLVKTFQDYINPVNQRTSLKEAYDQMVKDSGVQAIDMELVDMKAVIEGTEDDLRLEIQGAGGTATESQVIALANARNKQLIKNYNRLVDTRNAKEKYLQTAIGLESMDRQSADQRFENMFNMGIQLADISQKMQTNAVAGIERIAKTIGWDGILAAVGDDPYAVSLIEKTYGLPQGGLMSAASQATIARTQAEQERQLDLEVKRGQIKTPEEKALDIQYKQAQISNMYSEIAKRKADNTVVFDPFGKLVVKPEEALKINKEMVNSDAYKALTKAKDSLQFLKNFEDKFKETGATSAMFSPRQNADLKSKYTASILNLKEFFNLGVVNGPDEKYLMGILPDPTNRSAFLTGISLGIYKPSAATKSGIDNMKKMVETTIDDRYKSLSSQYGDYSSYSVNGLRDLNRVYVESKAKLNPDIQKLISENPNLTPEDVLMVIR